MSSPELNVLLGFLVAISLFIFSTSNVYPMNETAINEQFDKSHYFEFSNVVSDYKHRTGTDLLSIFGAVKNNSTLDFENVLLGLAMYDKQDVLVNFASNAIFSDLDHPGGTSTFTFNIEMDPSLMYDHYTLLVAAKSQVGEPLANIRTGGVGETLKVLSMSSFTDSIGYLHVVGEIENNTPDVAKFVKATGTFYDSNNQIVATDFTYTSPTDLAPGDKAPFEIILSSASVPLSQIDHYRVVPG